MIAGYALNLWLVPASLTAFREFQWEIRNRMAAFLLQEGVFTSVSDDAHRLRSIARSGRHPAWHPGG